MSDVTEAEFVEEATAFLEDHAELRAEQRSFTWGEGSDKVSLFKERTPEQVAADVEAAKGWRRRKYDAGLGWITGPTELGGRGLPTRLERVYNDLERRYDVPDQAPFQIGLGMVAPTILAHGQHDVAEQYLPQMYRADVIGCQLFSEPGAGSDLASLQMRAERDGEEWILNGQKVWTSGAQYSDIGEIIARTDPDMPKHKGLTGFVVDMRADGVEIRPLRQMTGGASFNEVYFTDVRVPDDHRLGEVNDGWRVALTTLMNERAAIGAGGGSGSSAGSFTRLREMARHYGLLEHPVVRQQLMDVYSRTKMLTWTGERGMAKIRSGQLPGPEMSITKLALTENMRRTAGYVGRVLGPRLQADSGEWGTWSFHEYVLGVPGMAIAGGTDEVLRNIVGERVLGLPKEPGIDTTTAFKDLKVGTQRS